MSEEKKFTEKDLRELLKPLREALCPSLEYERDETSRIMGVCNICHKDGAKHYGRDPNEPDYEYWFCDKCAGICITPTGEPIKEVRK